MVSVRTWRRKVQLHLPQLSHGGLQLLHDDVITVEEGLSDPLLKKLPKLLQGHLQQALCSDTQITCQAERLGSIPKMHLDTTHLHIQQSAPLGVSCSGFG